MGLLDGTNQSTYYGSGNAANYGNYQFTSLEHIINAFMVAYVGESKILSKVNRTDVQFHAMRAVQELSYDVLKSFKSQEIEVPNTLSMILPQDYVNYTKIARIGSDGIERVLYPASKTSDPFAITQNTDGTYDFGQQKRVVTVTLSDITSNYNVLSETYLTLGYKTTNTYGTATQSFVSFRFEAAGSELNDYDNPTGEGAVFGIDNEPGDTEETVAPRLLNAINAFGHHTATQSSGTGSDEVLTITYNDDLVNSTTVTNTENTYDGDGAELSSNMVIAVSDAGTATGDDAVEQVPSNTSANFESQTPNDYYSYNINDSSDVEILPEGRRYGLDPQYSQINGSFFIDQLRGLIKFGSALAGKTITLHYVSDGLGTDAEMVVHKFCEEAVYKHIAYGILSTRSNIPPFIIQRFKKERFAETRKAKIRLSNIKIEEFTQVLKGMSKQIK